MIQMGPKTVRIRNLEAGRTVRACVIVLLSTQVAMLTLGWDLKECTYLSLWGMSLQELLQHHCCMLIRNGGH